MKVIGIQERSGEYQGNKYHNVMIHCTKESDDSYGEITEVIKVKFANVREVFGKAMSAADWQNLLHNTIYVNYDRYGIVQSVQIAEVKK